MLDEETRLASNDAAEDKAEPKESVSDDPWSNFSESDYDDAQWKRACLLDTGSGNTAKQRYSLPVKEPDGTLNKNGVHAAASRFGQAQGPPDAKAKAAAALRSAYSKIGETPPDSIKNLDDDVDDDDEEDLVKAFLAMDLGESEPTPIKNGHKVKFTKKGAEFVGVVKRIVAGVAMIKTESGKHRFVKVGKLSLVEKPANLSTVYQLPYDLDSPVQIAKRLFRKHLVPIGQHLKKDGVSLDFSRENLQKMVDNFKDKAFDRVYFTAKHSREAEDVRGVVRDMFVADDGLYADIEVSDEGEKILKNSLGEICTSPSFIPDYTREADGRHFGPSIQHIAATPTPHVPGTKFGELLSENISATVVDLSEAEYTADEQGKEGAAVTDTVNTEQESKEEVKELSADQMQRAIELAKAETEALREEVKTAKAQSGATAKALAEQRIDRYLDEQKRQHGVMPFVAELARPLLLSAELSSEESKHQVVSLSDEGAEAKELNFSEIVKQLVEASNKVDLSEMGRKDLEPPAEDRDTKIDQLVQGRLKERSLGQNAYSQVFDEMMRGGELNA